MKQINVEISRDIIIDTVKSMTPEQLEQFIQKNYFDFRIWFKVKIDGKEVPWWID